MPSRSPATTLKVALGQALGIAGVSAQTTPGTAAEAISRTVPSQVRCTDAALDERLARGVVAAPQRMGALPATDAEAVGRLFPKLDRTTTGRSAGFWQTRMLEPLRASKIVSGDEAEQPGLHEVADSYRRWTQVRPVALRGLLSVFRRDVERI